MSKRNHFTQKFEGKSTKELKSIVSDGDYQRDAVLAAMWILEDRGEASDKDEATVQTMEAEHERKEAKKISDRKYATFLPRIIAGIIDGLFMWPIGYLLNFLINSDIQLIIVFGSLLNVFAPYIYAIFFHGRFGQTIGKMLMEVKLVDFRTEEAIGYKQAFKRDSVPVVLIALMNIYAYAVMFGKSSFEFPEDFITLAPAFFIGILGILWTVLEIISLLFNEKSRAIHDLIAGTVVVRTD